MSASRGTWLRVGVSAGLLAIILLNLDTIGDVGRLLLAAAPAYVALVFLVMTLDRFLMTYKWLMLLKSRGKHLPLLQGVKIYCSAMLWGLFLPATVGADAIRGYMTSREGVDGYEAFASIAVERLVGFVAALVFGLASILILSSFAAADPRLHAIWALGALTTSFAVIALALSFSDRLFQRAMGLLPPRARNSRLMQRLAHFHAVYRGYGAQHAVIAAFFVLTLTEQCFVVLGMWVTALALHLDVGLLFVAGVVPLSMLISRLPISIDGLGVFEGVMVLLLSLAGISAAEAVALSLAGRVIQILVWLPWWFAYTVRTGLIRPPKNAVPFESSGR